jgi:hypothetical protein
MPVELEERMPVELVEHKKNLVAKRVQTMGVAEELTTVEERLAGYSRNQYRGC